MPKTERISWEDARSSFKDEQRRSIVGAALGLLMDEGASGLTMASLADRAGISRQTLYRYFPDLDSVLAASVDGIAEADEHFRQALLSEGEPREQLHRAVDALIDASGHGSEQIEAFLAALPPDARSHVQAHRQRTIDLLGEILSTLGSRPDSPYDADPSTDAELIFGLVSVSDDRSRERTHRIIDLILEHPTLTRPLSIHKENPA